METETPAVRIVFRTFVVDQTDRRLRQLARRLLTDRDDALFTPIANVQPEVNHYARRRDEPLPTSPTWKELGGPEEIAGKHVEGGD